MNDMVSSEIAHTGKIVSMTPTVTTVEIISASACSSCHAAGLCGAADAVRKQIEVPTGEARGHAVGDVVDVVLAQSLGLKAQIRSLNGTITELEQQKRKLADYIRTVNSIRNAG